MNRKTVVSLLLVATSLGLSASPANASTRLSVDTARQRAHTKMDHMQSNLRSEGANESSVRGCWREGRRAVGCLGLVSGKDSFLRWQCAVPMTVHKRLTATASGLFTVKFTDPMCSF